MKHLFAGVLGIVALFACQATSRAAVVLNNDTNFTMPYQFMQQGQQDWSQTEYLKPWYYSQFANQELLVRFQTGAGLKEYQLEPNRSYSFKVTTAGTIDLYGDPGH